MIESTQNETVKRVRTLHSKKGREEQGLHFIEGLRLVEEAMNSGLSIPFAFIEEGHEAFQSRLLARGTQVQLVARKVMEALTQTQTPQWVCACVETPECRAPEEYPEGFLVALDVVQDPGNLGTVLRTADAMGCCGILLGEGCADAFAPKTLRAGMGSVYHIPVWTGNLQRELGKLKGQGFALICGHLQGGEELPAIEKNCALVIGNEGRGVSAEIASMCSLYKLPMYGKAESLNASVAAGILMYTIAQEIHNTKDRAIPLKK